jgi:hypothetical protein
MRGPRLRLGSTSRSPVGRQPRLLPISPFLPCSGLGCYRTDIDHQIEPFAAQLTRLSKALRLAERVATLMGSPFLAADLIVIPRSRHRSTAGFGRDTPVAPGAHLSRCRAKQRCVYRAGAAAVIVAPEGWRRQNHSGAASRRRLGEQRKAGRRHRCRPTVLCVRLVRAACQEALPRRGEVSAYRGIGRQFRGAPCSTQIVVVQLMLQLGCCLYCVSILAASVGDIWRERPASALTRLRNALTGSSPVPRAA